MVVKFISKSFWIEVWKDEVVSREYKLIKNRKFKVEVYEGFESVVTIKGEFICRTDSVFFEENFQIDIIKL